MVGERVQGAIRGQGLKYIGFVWLLAFLVWLPFEDRRVWMSQVLAVSGTGWLYLRYLRNSFRPLWQEFGVGALAGLGAIAGTMTLFAFKSGLHGHGFSDFNINQAGRILAQTPLAMFCGAGFGFILRWMDQLGTSISDHLM